MRLTLRGLGAALRRRVARAEHAEASLNHLQSQNCLLQQMVPPPLMQTTAAPPRNEARMYLPPPSATASFGNRRSRSGTFSN